MTGRAVSLQEYAFWASRLLCVGVGDLADKLGPGHVHGPVHLAGLWSRIILEDFHHQSCVVGQNDTGLQHAQESDLALGLAEGSRGIDCHIGVQPLPTAVMAGKAAQTSSEMPAKISFLRPVASMARAMRASSKALTDERSMISMPGSASTSSGNVGPHMLSRAVVVATIGSFNALAAFARATTLCFNSPVE